MAVPKGIAKHRDLPSLHSHRRLIRGGRTRSCRVWLPVVEASGDVPGFAPKQLTLYIANQMQQAAGAPWDFAAGHEAPSASNRIVWSFKTLRVIWQGGDHRGFRSPSRSSTYLSAEVKLYLNDAYQTTILVEPTVVKGIDDVGLAEAVRYVTRAMFIENQRDVR